MGRTEIAGFQPQTYKTLQSDATKTTISQHKINDMGVVQGELHMSWRSFIERMAMSLDFAQQVFNTPRQDF
jgi:hypothetical protein